MIENKLNMDIYESKSNANRMFAQAYLAPLVQY